MVKTLAAKHKSNVSTIYRKYGRYTEDGKRIIAVEIPRKGKKSLIASYGKKSITRNCKVIIHDVLTDNIHTFKRTEIVDRLLRDECEICGSRDRVQGHHIRKLKDLKNRYKGRKEPAEWVKRMIAMTRKTLFVCWKHHKEIHEGVYDGAKLA